eukprot:a508808_253.p1 GENE.a508808_253~~a508808_253.p1  ORF type:complete len:342 (+),score=113.71 a508808_253:86-1027(+)
MPKKSLTARCFPHSAPIISRVDISDSEVEFDESDIDWSADLVSESIHTDGTFIKSGYCIDWRKKLYRFLENKYFRAFIITLIFVDVVAISFEIAIGQGSFGKVEKEEGVCRPAMFNCSLPEEEQPEEIPAIILISKDHKLEEIEDGLHILSLCLLSVFLAELLASLVAAGFEFLCNFLHLFDAAIVITALFIEIFARKRGEFLGFIVALRLLRIIQGVVDSEREAHERTAIHYHRVANHSKYVRKLLKRIIAQHQSSISEPELREARWLLAVGPRFRRHTYKQLFGEEREANLIEAPTVTNKYEDSGSLSDIK